MEVITLTLGSERYAIESRFTFEIFALSEFSRVPGARGTLFGLTVWRGGLLTLLDVRTSLGIPATALHDLTRVIVLGDSKPEFGMLADRVHDLRTLDVTELEHFADERATSRRPFVQGVTSDATIVLNGPQLLTLHG